MKTLKTNLYISFILFFLIFGNAFAYAGSEITGGSPANVSAITDLSNYAPVAPLVAGFEDAASVYTTDYHAISITPTPPCLACFNDLVPDPAPAYVIAPPTAPKEATFDDSYNQNNIVSESLLELAAPVTPKEADFSENEDIPVNLSPMTPATADFDELL
ncbi:MAG TPA: hypothetical protein VMC08_07690 [Bacteroidales bacterium]|nr:hypothetical protein [Bacteroidales bacterium]